MEIMIHGESGLLESNGTASAGHRDATSPAGLNYPMPRPGRRGRAQCAHAV